ncbi:tail fiber domain-containing protein [Aeromonas hydrophila]|uniref:tail fiber domain-containing protein n=1 Tax=Aeromonas hydrophila TaxID=644 RepID=UPI00214D6DF7|nr:tail fiber domain-containing protein [Aeromonas hydrophila]MCR3907572.1 tail fiber domain-containing protein [Aeromonas hydrophila]
MGFKVEITELSNLPNLKSTGVAVTEYAGIGTKTTKVVVVDGTNIGFSQVTISTNEAKAAAAAAKVSEQNTAATLASSVKKVGDTMTGTLNMGAVPGKQISFDNGNSYISNTYGNLYIRSNANEQSKVIIQGNAHPDVTVGTNTGKFYTELNKPTPAEIGTLTAAQINASLNLKSDLTYVNAELGKMLNLSGGVMTGNINSTATYRTSINQSLGFVMQRTGTTYQAGVGQGSDGMAVIGTGTETNLEAWLKVGPSTLNFTGNKVYHSGDKPLPLDIGALPLTGGVMSGAIRWDIDTKKYINGSGDNMYVSAQNGRVYIEGKLNPAVRLITSTGSTDYDIYHVGNKPTAADVGTMTTAQINSALALKSDLNYVNTELAKKSDLTYVNTELGKKLNLSGGTLTGALIVANTKGAIKVDNQKSISFQDQSSTMYHLLSEGNNFKIKHGNNADNPIFDISSSAIAANTPMYSRNAMIIQDSTGTKWIGLETPAGTNPYISVRSLNDTQNRVAMTFEKGAIKLATDTLVAPSVMVQNNGGLVFSPQSDRAGLTWGMGVDPASGDLCTHRYNNGNWAALPVIIKGDGTLHAVSGLKTSIINCNGNAAIDGSLAVIQSIDVRGGYMSLTSQSNTLLEFHTPGRTAFMIYKGPEGNARFVTSNGSGGETFLRMQLDTGGNMSVAGAVWATSFNPGSDRRIKSNIVVLENCLEKNAKIIPCSYNKLGLPEGKREVGVIAQDVIEVLPDAVSEGPDGFYGVNYASVTSLNTGAINELYKIVQELQEEIRILKGK